MRCILNWIAVFIICCLGLACVSRDLPQIFVCDEVVTYDLDVLPILEANCQFSGCHPDNGNWFDYETAKNISAEMKRRILLPKSDSDHMPMEGSLSNDEIETIVCWVNTGTQQN